MKIYYLTTISTAETEKYYHITYWFDTIKSMEEYPDTLLFRQWERKPNTYEQLSLDI